MARNEKGNSNIVKLICMDFLFSRTSSHTVHAKHKKRAKGGLTFYKIRFISKTQTLSTKQRLILKMDI